MGRVGMDQRADVGAHAQDLGMDEDLDVDRHVAGHFLALQVDGDEIVGGDLLQADIVRLHEEARIVAGQARGDVAENEVALILAGENAPGVDQRFLERVDRCHLVHSISRAGAPPETDCL